MYPKTDVPRQCVDIHSGFGHQHTNDKDETEAYLRPELVIWDVEDSLVVERDTVTNKCEKLY